MKRSEWLKFRPVVTGLEDRQLRPRRSRNSRYRLAPRGMVAGPGGDLWFTLADDQVGRITPDGQVTTFSIPPSYSGPAIIPPGRMGTSGSPMPTAPESDESHREGSSQRSPRAQALTTSSPAPTATSGSPSKRPTRSAESPRAAQITEFPAPQPTPSAMGITAGPDGNLWFTEYRGDKIGRITTDGAFAEFPIAGLPVPVDIAAGADGKLWFTSAWGSIYRITTAGEYTLFPLHPAQSYPIGYTPPNPGLADIAAGPDGNLSFTESQTNLIGRMTPAGVVTEFPVPTDNSTPLGIATGPDGNIWFAESKGNKIARFSVTTTDLGVAVSPLPAPGTVGQGLTYTITVTNHGPAEATDVVLTEEFLPTSTSTPQPTTTYSATASQGTVRAAPFLAQLGSLASGASATVTVVMVASGHTRSRASSPSMPINPTPTRPTTRTPSPSRSARDHRRTRRSRTRRTS